MMRTTTMHDPSPFIENSAWRILLLGFLAAFAASSTAVAQDSVTGATSTAGATAAATGASPTGVQYQGEYFTPNLREVFRLRHVKGHGQGDVPSFTHFGFTKLTWDESGVSMFDAVARLTNDAEAGWSLGIHRRTVWNEFLLGTGVYFDQQHYDETFRQLVLTNEIFRGLWSFRSNGYIVLGEDVVHDEEYGTTGATTIGFQENYLVAENLLLTEQYDVAMNGFDVEFGRRLDGVALELFAGGYYYDGAMGDKVVGGKGGVRGFVVPDVAASVTVASDDEFGTNVFAGLTWFLGARGGLSRPYMMRLLTVPVERNEQVVVNRFEESRPVAGPVVLTDGDDPIFIAHVQEGHIGANEGTYADPFNALPETQEADIVYVHADGIFMNQSYSLAVDQRLLGESPGVVHVVDTEELGEVVLPIGSGGTARPEIRMALGDAITLAGEENEVSNFLITEAGRHGIYGNGVNKFDINRNVITDSDGRGIFLENVTADIEDNLVASGRVAGNIVSGSAEQNIQITLNSDFEGEVTGNTANSSIGSAGISVSGPFRFEGDISDNIANFNALDGILVEVDEFFGEVEDNTAIDNGASGIVLMFDFGEVDVLRNTANLNSDHGIALSVMGDYFSDIDVSGNTANNNVGAEGLSLTFAGTGTSVVEVRNNNFSGNNSTTDREFIAQVEDVFENSPKAYILLKGNTSTNALGAGPPFNYEFDNTDLFSDGRMIVDVGFNVGTVGLGEGVEEGKLP